MTTPAQKEILEITDIEVLRGLCLIANEVIEALGEQFDEQEKILESYQQNAIDYRREIADANKVERRYELLKYTLPALLEISATSGPDAAEVLAGIQIEKLDGFLDAELARGTLEEIYDTMDEDAEASLNEVSDGEALAAYEARGIL